MHSRRRILLTGFDPFADLRENTSELVVRAIEARRSRVHPARSSRVELITAVLPTKYEAAGRKIRRLIREHGPDVVICLGVATTRDSIQLERVALNLNDSDTRDNAASVRRGHHIVRNGPAAYWSTLPLPRMLSRLRAAGVAASISNHAGTFLCNHVFYLARHALASAGKKTACGFIHLPPLASDRDHSLARIIEAVEVCLRAVAKP